MDITTFLGIAALGGIIGAGVYSGDLPSSFLNWHGLLIVLGGTASAMLVNTPLHHLVGSFGSLWVLVRGQRFSSGPETIAAVVTLAEQVQARGISALQDADPAAAGGYLGQAAQAAIEYNNPELVEQILESEIRFAYSNHNEIVNVYRTASVLAPMFGLLGTLLGIVQVLKHIASPEQVGPAMAIAITTAFYGIALSNMICVPIAGKLRIRYMEEMRTKTLIAEGIVMMLRGTVPLVIQRKLQAYL